MMGKTPLHYAVLTQNSRLAQILISLGADSSLRDFYQMKPLDLTNDKELKELISSRNLANSNN